MATTAPPINSIHALHSHLPNSSWRRQVPRLRLSSRLQSTAVRASVATAPLPTLTKSPNGIVLIDPSEKEKVHRLKLHYLEKVIPLLKVQFGYTNIHQVPKLEKIVVNSGIGDAQQNSKGFEVAMKNMTTIIAQRPVKTVARESVASFKVREGNTLGLMATLRGKYMYSFLDRLINLTLPRTTDFQGLNPRSFDGTGNYSLGLTDQGAFPELENLGKQHGMEVSIKTTARTDEEAMALLSLMGMPFREKKEDEVVRKKKRYKKHHFASKPSRPIKKKKK
ncbi:50S ribosomal protein L5 isoform X1 [Carex littledalei]|uniref:Large ribosomal subunit protein uL5c n=1 Tax=Carex littledalei TaxID=544730 RepID=A0A833QD12_9POAL|nr:50S ribosomal protein L5 isoform X1 [Carex littledalei]